MGIAETDPEITGVVEKETALREAPSSDAKSFGRLPVGTVVNLGKERRGKYVFIGVELEDGDLEGWVLRGSIRIDGEKETVQLRDRLKIPSDEKILMARDPSYFYGAHLGGTYGILQSDASTSVYTGFGLLVGAEGGIYLRRNIPLRIELNYTQYNGVSSDDNLNLGFGFFDVALIPQYVIEPFELFLGFQYSFGLSVKDIPKGIVVTSASDLSSLWGLVGLGYRFRIGTVSEFILRGRYAFSFSRSPFVIQGFSIFGAVQMQI